MSGIDKMNRKIESMRKYLEKWYNDTDNDDRPKKNHIAILLQDISEIQVVANGADKSTDKALHKHIVSKRSELLEAFLDEYIEAWEDGMAGSSSLLHDAKKLKGLL